MGLYPENGFSREYDGTGEYRWISQNCYQYGFVVRYESDKIDITKIGNEPWHIRYVGVPHAYVMKKQDLCFLEEYMDYLKDFPYDGKHLMVTDDKNQKYEIYYVAAPAGEKIISVPVPETGNYEISGSNTDGFIVTVSLSFKKGVDGMKILVVDDEKEIADLVELYLSNENYIVYKFYHPLDALS